MLLVIHCYHSEIEQLKEIQLSNSLEKTLPYLTAHVSARFFLLLSLGIPGVAICIQLG